MKLITLASGSSGNCYLLQSKNGKFCILDCGIKFKYITNKEEFNGFGNLDFVFCSHVPRNVHKDHSLSLEDFKNSGCEIISYENIGEQKRIEIGEWIIYPFHVKHNVENFGCIIYNILENKKIVYATDFTQMPKIQNVDYWLYEINYDEFTLDKVIENQDISKLHIANNIEYHNSLENAIEYFGSLDNKPKLIVACHTSKMGGTIDIIRKRMRPLCDIVEIAEKNMIINF